MDVASLRGAVAEQWLQLLEVRRLSSYLSRAQFSLQTEQARLRREHWATHRQDSRDAGLASAILHPGPANTVAMLAGAAGIGSLAATARPFADALAGTLLCIAAGAFDPEILGAGEDGASEDSAGEDDTWIHEDDPLDEALARDGWTVALDSGVDVPLRCSGGDAAAGEAWPSEATAAEATPGKAATSGVLARSPRAAPPTPRSAEPWAVLDTEDWVACVEAFCECRTEASNEPQSEFEELEGGFELEELRDPLADSLLWSEVEDIGGNLIDVSADSAEPSATAEAAGDNGVYVRARELAEVGEVLGAAGAKEAGEMCESASAQEAQEAPALAAGTERVAVPGAAERAPDTAEEEAGGRSDVRPGQVSAGWLRTLAEAAAMSASAASGAAECPEQLGAGSPRVADGQGKEGGRAEAVLGQGAHSDTQAADAPEAQTKGEQSQDAPATGGDRWQAQATLRGGSGCSLTKKCASCGSTACLVHWPMGKYCQTEDWDRRLYCTSCWESWNSGDVCRRLLVREYAGVINHREPKTPIWRTVKGANAVPVGAAALRHPGVLQAMGGVPAGQRRIKPRVDFVSLHV